MTITGYQKAVLRAVVADLRREAVGADSNDTTFVMSRRCGAAANLLERRYLTEGPANAADSIDWGSVAADGL